MNPRTTAMRLRYCATYLEEVKEENFAMGNWCGTAQCVAGHIASSPKGKEWGLRINRDSRLPMFVGKKIPDPNDMTNDVRPKADKAIAVALGITSLESHGLCYNCHETKAKKVERLRNLATKYMNKWKENR